MSHAVQGTSKVISDVEGSRWPQIGVETVSGSRMSDQIFDESSARRPRKQSVHLKLADSPKSERLSQRLTAL
jgi:hypothetical protein